MPRDLPLGNGCLLVNFDPFYRVRDIYFPRVGRENHTLGEPCRFGVWVDGIFRWIEDPGWKRELRYAPDTLVTAVRLFHPDLALEIECTDAVDMASNLFLRRFTVCERTERPREVRIFLHHDFHILENAVGDTAYFEPERRCVIHYKRKRWFLLNGGRYGPAAAPETSVDEGPCPAPGFTVGIDQFATGIKGFGGKEGTWRDAEDGTLEGNPIAQGSVDSTVALHARTDPAAPAVLYFWMAAGRTFDEVAELNRAVRRRGPEDFLGRTRAYWELWVEAPGDDLDGLPAEIVEAYRRSLLILRTQIDAGGGITAANDYDITRFARDTYSYVWPRDGALTAYALAGAGHFSPCQAFYDFCHRVIAAEGYFLHKYNPDGSLASSWHPWQGARGKQIPVQEDETGLVVWALWKHLERFRDVEWMMGKYRGLVARAGGWMADYRDPATGLPRPSYDLWEERYGVHAFTVAATWAGLTAASRFAWRFNEGHLAQRWKSAADGIKAAADRFLYREELGRFARTVVPDGRGGLEADPVLDASLHGLWYFGMYAADDPRVVRTLEAVRDRLWVRTEVGGLARYEGDVYQRAAKDVPGIPGNPWFICTLWRAQWRIATAASLEELSGEPLELLRWAASRAMQSGVLAEQVHPHTNEPLSVSPLTWSHATFVAAVLEYAARRNELRGAA